jgi:hypothetical protein
MSFLLPSQDELQRFLNKVQNPVLSETAANLTRSPNSKNAISAVLSGNTFVNRARILIADKISNSTRMRSLGNNQSNLITKLIANDNFVSRFRTKMLPEPTSSNLTVEVETSTENIEYANPLPTFNLL